MIETLIAGAAGVLANSAGAKEAGKELSTAIWTDFLRPIFLKDDPEEGAAAVARIEAAPAAPASQELVADKLRTYLPAHPEAQERLGELLQQHGTTVNNHGSVKNQFINNRFEGPVQFD